MAMQRPLPFGSMTVLENVVLGAMFGVNHGVLAEREARRRRLSRWRSWVWMSEPTSRSRA